MSQQIFQQRIVTEMDAEYGAATDPRFARAISKAIIGYMTDHVVVSVQSVSGVTTGPGVSGPGTGTIGFL